MVLFPNCKINIGLDILFRRDDGFHEIETLMYPVRGLCDILEVVSSDTAGVRFTSSGLSIDCDSENNLCVKAYELMRSRYDLSGVNIHLHKITPFGAGLGGGSADAAHTIKGLDKLFELGLTTTEMEEIAGQLGSDTPFFIQNTSVIAKGRGEITEPYEVPQLKGKLLIIVKPPFGVSTAEAYAGIKPAITNSTLAERLTQNISEWRGNVLNGFEPHIFKAYPELDSIKNTLYDNGALYASMSGSGSSVFGIFDAPENITTQDTETTTFRRRHPVCDKLDIPHPELFIYQEIIQ